jgi:hypothetical protein
MICCVALGDPPFCQLGANVPHQVGFGAAARGRDRPLALNRGFSSVTTPASLPSRASPSTTQRVAPRQGVGGERETDPIINVQG